MPQYDRSAIRKGMFMTGQPCGADWRFGQQDTTQPLCTIYKAAQQQQPSVSLAEIGARIEAVRKKVEALRTTLQKP